jgi:hypothetical protein
MCWNLLKNLFGNRQQPPDSTQVTSNPDPNYREYPGGPPADIDNPEWKVVKINPEGITVSWQEKYGASMQENCIGLWYSESKQMYMLTWKDDKKIYIMKDNINDIEVS